MFVDPMALAFMLVAALAVIAYKAQSRPIMLVASIIVVILGLRMYQDTPDLILLALTIMLALGAPFVVKG